MKTNRNTARKTTLAWVISSVLLGTVAAQANHHVEPSRSPPVKVTSPPEESRPATTPASDADTSAGTKRTEVGSPKSNVDEDSSSGSYYPYSAGTVGDDPAEPTSTSVPADAGDDHSGPTDQWDDAADSDGDGYLSRAELDAAAPALSASFDAMDVNDDDKLTRAEFRTWHESRKARMDAEPGARPTADDKAPNSPTPPGDTGD
jgi:hypothetical protein